jgi:dsRNA-specific ribonuclease
MQQPTSHQQGWWQAHPNPALDPDPFPNHPRPATPTNPAKPKRSPPPPRMTPHDERSVGLEDDWQDALEDDHLQGLTFKSRQPATALPLATCKTHKSILIELTTKLGIGAPVYSLLSQHGPPHAPTFEVAVSLPSALAGPGGDASAAPLVAGGEGPSLKAAEQAAARAALDTAVGRGLVDVQQIVHGDVKHVAAEPGAAAELSAAAAAASGGGNLKGALQELVASGRLEPLGVPAAQLPTYSSVAAAGPGHRMSFTESVSLPGRGGLSATGTAHSRKAAQAAAAAALLGKIGGRLRE